MEIYKFDRTDFEELYFALSNFEKNYKVKFDEEEFDKIESFEDFTERIVAKFDFAEMQDCTYQQAFYKLRRVIKDICPEISDITLDTKLESIFPPKNRKQKIAELKKKLGFDFKILGAKMWITSILVITIFACFFLMFVQLWTLVVFIFSIFILKVVEKYGNAFTENTIRDLVNHLVKQHYFECRKYSNTINKKEFRNVILDYFAEEMCLDKEQLKTARFM